MKRVVAVLLVALCSALFAAGPANATVGFKGLDVTYTGPDGSPAMQAGSHPFAMTTTFEVKTKLIGPNEEIPDEDFKDLEVDIPPGLMGTPNPVPRCALADFLFIDGAHDHSNCPDSTVIGVAQVAAALNPIEPGKGLEELLAPSPVFNLAPSPGSAAKFGFVAPDGVPVTIEAGLNPNPPYNLQAHVTNIPQAVMFFSTRLTLWGVPASPAHDDERGHCVGPGADSCPVNLPEVPFLTMPRSCRGPLHTQFAVRGWQNPSTWVNAETISHDNSVPPQQIGTSGCSALSFEPEIASQPTTSSAESSSGLDFNINFDDKGLTSPNGIAGADIEKAVVTLPKGVTANPSVANGLATCSEADLARETISSQPGEGCPQASKIGTVEVETPLLEDTVLKGEVFIASQGANPFNSLLAQYVVIREPTLGVLVKLAGEIKPDPTTGQLVTTFGTAPGFAIPQVPFSHFRFHFRSGPRAPLVTPPTCDGDPGAPGNNPFVTTAELTPTSGAPPIVATSSFRITSGPNGAPCPQGNPGLNPGFTAGTTNNTGSTYSPYLMRFTRNDGEQDLTRFDAVLPAGVAGKLAGIPECPDASIEAAKSTSGLQQLANPSCPAASQIGRVVVGAGVGSDLTYATGSVYLAGPFAGDPMSVVVITPAVAGPFDVGTVVTREGLTVNLLTAEAEIDGAHAEPIPRILKGVPLKVRDIRVYIDRPNFTFNATSCDPEASKATIFGSFLDVFNHVQGASVSRDARYQAANCGILAFRPKLKLEFKGGTRRSDHPKLHSVVSYPYPSGPGYANIGRAVVLLPASEFIDQNHINNPCTRVQFNANACPKGSILGHARAFTPILAKPLEGPVYFRSNGGERELPDIVADLKGQFHVTLVGFVDSVRPKGKEVGRIRTTFANVPDTPVSHFTLDLKGGKKGLLVNSVNLCNKPRRAKVTLTGKNGKRIVTNHPVRTKCKHKKHKKSKKGHHKGKNGHRQGSKAGKHRH